MTDSPYRIYIKPQFLNWIVLALVMLGTTLFLVHVSNRAVAEIDALSNEPVFLGRHELVDTASWRTYRNEKYGFEVKYPSDFLFDENFYGKEARAEFSVSFGPPSNDNYGVLKSKALYTLIISTHRLFGQETLESYAKSDSGGDGPKRTVISGEEALNFKYYAELGNFYTYTIYLLHNGLIFNFIDDQESNDVSSTFVQILSTFKFIK